MGLGKTVMTIALILSRKGHGIPDDHNVIPKGSLEDVSNRRRKQKGGTLIVCPMALLSQWKVNPQNKPYRN